jgi:16S rRNA processing protein RimM
MADWESMVLVGRIARPHGLRGHVVVTPDTDFVAERFRAGAQLWTRVAGRDEVLTIVEARVEGRRPVVGFEGYGSVEAAEGLAGRELRVPESSLQPLPAGSYYLHQLAGCRVETVDGVVVGEVVRVDGGVGAAMLTVNASTAGAGAAEVLVPFVQEICVGVDLDARVIRVQMPEGLREINEPGPARQPKQRTGSKKRRGALGRNKARLDSPEAVASDE